MSRKKIAFPNDFEFYYISSKEETEYIYSEIFTEQQYLQNGIVINEGDYIFDVGANIGLFSLFVNRIQNKVKIYAFEPIEQTFLTLEENTRLHNLDNIQLFNYGISSEDNPEKIFIFYPNMAGNSTTKPGDIIADADDVKEEIDSEHIEDLFTSFFEEEQQVKCQVRTLSSVMNELGINSIDLLKIDVEGAEYEVLQGIADKDWPKIKQIVGEVHNKKGRVEKIQQLLISHGFNIKLEKREQLPSTYVDTYNLYAVR
ncbi:MAG: FkbM family methyltransferase [Aulosira sp. ZfuVER01]|nr:FkbM family methyltransferase [Aulosira sp. ZfuVER01]MDZ8003034.1 FkbM family methyltransferase [Aulosira sp. DedVER01a]MDZ8050290.1 FkbM family methyltransferase [Aulosira sp. ZfuCHP01]